MSSGSAATSIPEHSASAVRTGRRAEAASGGPSTASAPRTAVAASVAGTLLLALIGAAAPNDHTLDARLPLLGLPALPGPASTYLTILAIAAQGLGLLGLLRAAGRGWRPRVGVLLAAGGAATALLCAVTPVGSADVASYAAYGRIAVLGGDPYVTTPAWLGGGYAHLVSSSWLYTPSVYGPLATWVQEGAAALGGSRAWLTIWLLILFNAAAYQLTGLLLVRAAGDRVRAALLWSANPLLIGQLVAGGHLDTLVALLAVAAAGAALRARRPSHEVVVGLLLGSACGLKVSAALLAVGLTWPLLRQRAWTRIAVRTLSCAALLLAVYAPLGAGALAPLLGASQLVSVPSFWQFVRWAGRAVLGTSATAALISIGWPVLMAVCAALLHRAAGRPQGPRSADAATAGATTAGATPPAIALPAAAPPGSGSAGAAPPLRAAHALAFGWVLAAPWCMPWYTALVWPLAALLPRNRTDAWLVWATLALALVHNTGGHGWSW